MELTAALLADAARIENGKLYIYGGGWDTITVASFPTMHPTMSLAWILRIEYDEALSDIPIMVELIDEDGSPLGPRLEGVINTGHAPRQQRGTPSFIPQTFTLNLLQFEKPGTYSFRIRSGETELGAVPFRLILLQQGPSTERQ